MLFKVGQLPKEIVRSKTVGALEDLARKMHIRSSLRRAGFFVK